MGGKNKTAIARMKELGVEISENEKGVDFLIPHSFDVTEGVEFGFLLSQLSTHSYPKNFTGLCGVNSTVYSKTSKCPPVHFVESFPHGLKYRIYRKGVKR